MPSNNRQTGAFSPTALLAAVVIAFLTGLLMSLAIRPAATPTASSSPEPAAALKRIEWRLPSAFHTTIPGLGRTPETFAETVRAASAGAIEFRVFEPGEVVPAFSITDAVRDKKVEAGYTWSGYDQGKIPASPLIGAVPFGMEPIEFLAWWFDGGGKPLGEALYHEQRVHPILCGLIGPETAGWFRQPIEDLDDLAGLKIRFAGIGGKVIERLGASVTMLPGGEIFQALEKGAIDATEFSQPIVDQVLGFNRIASFNYYPGWHQPASASHLMINLDKWNALSASDQAIIEAACYTSTIRTIANSESLQGPVIAGFSENGVSAETLPENVLRELHQVTLRVLDEEAAANEWFERILESQVRFRETYRHWKVRGYLPRDF